jgi:hypothetical protein
MMHIAKHKLLKVAFLVWTVLWVWFVVRDLFLKDNFNSYRILLARSLDGKHSYVTGDRLYELLKFASGKIPAGSSYNFAGLEQDSIENKRAIYYLYPLIEKEDPEYILVYDKPGFEKKGYVLMEKMDESRYILRRKGG